MLSRAGRGGPRQLGLLWGLVALLLVAIAPVAPQFVTTLPACPLRTLIALPCPTCGAMRAALALSRFDLWGAVMANPLAALAWILLEAGGVVAGILALADVPVREPNWQLSVRSRAVLVTILLANWLYLLGAGI